MALMKCLDCGNNVSTSAPACPSCGCPTPRQAIPMQAQQTVQRKSVSGTVFKVVGGFIVAWVGVIVVSEYVKSESDKPYASRHEESSPAATTPTAPSAEPVAVTALVSAYDENEVAADNSYKGHHLRITAPIKSIGKDIMDSPYLTFGQAFKGVNCYFDSNQASAIATMRKGKTVTVEGDCRGLTLGSVIMKDCMVVSQ